MSEVKERMDVPPVEQKGEKDIPPIPEAEPLSNCHFQDTDSLFEDAFKQAGLMEQNQEKTAGDAESQGESEHSSGEYLEKGEDGKYYDKETGEAYDSKAEWEAKQETQAKRYESTADYYEEKAAKEWARFKNAEENGETDAEKWEHYRKSQEYYAKAKECREKAQHIRMKLGQNQAGQSASVSFTGLGNELRPRLTTVAEESSSSRWGNRVAFTGKVDVNDGKEAKGSAAEACDRSEKPVEQSELQNRFDTLRGRDLSDLTDAEKKELVSIAVDNMAEKYGDTIRAERFEQIRENVSFVDNDACARDCGISPQRARYILGYYNPATDSIRINEGAENRVDNILATLDHEAMHMATQKMNSYITGLKTNSILVPDGNVGMNEGLTEMYSIRNIQDLNPSYESRSYIANVAIMEKFEQVYGANELKEAYLTNDFRGVKRDFDAVMGKGQFYQFCNLFDSMHNAYSGQMFYVAEAQKNRLLDMVATYEKKSKEGES